MTYRVVIPPAVEREVASLADRILPRVHARITGLESRPRPPGVKKLAGGLFWRIRVGDYRVVYEIDDRKRTILLTRVRHRKDAYRGL